MNDGWILRMRQNQKKHLKHRAEKKEASFHRVFRIITGTNRSFHLIEIVYRPPAG